MTGTDPCRAPGAIESTGGTHEATCACRVVVGTGHRARSGTGQNQSGCISRPIPEMVDLMNAGRHRVQGLQSGSEFRAAVPRERGLQGQADDAAAVRRRARYLLQLGRRRADEQVKAGVLRDDRRRRRPRRAKTTSARPASAPSPATASSTASPSTSRRSSSGTTRICSRKAGVDAATMNTWDGFLAAVQEAQGRRHHAARAWAAGQVAGPFLLVATWSSGWPGRTASMPPAAARATASPASPSSRPAKVPAARRRSSRSRKAS